MSDNTQGSGSSLKGIRSRLPINTSGAASTLKHGFGQISESFSRGVESLKKSAQSRGGSTSVYCKGVRQLDNYGYEKFNLEDGGEEIFISRHSEKSMFNEDDSILIRATDGNFVTQPDTTKEIQVAEETVIEPTDTRRMFANVPVSDTPCEFHGVVGTIDGGRVVPTPVDTGFLSKMVKPAPGNMQKLDMDQPAYKEVTIQNAPEAPVESVPVNDSSSEGMVKVTPAEEYPEIIEETNDIADESAEVVGAIAVAGIVEASAEEPVEVPVEDVIEAPVEIPEVMEVPEEVSETIEAPVEESAEEVTVSPVEEIQTIEAPAESQEFFVGTEEETVESSVEEIPEGMDCDNNSVDDDYNMMFPDYEESEAVAGAAGVIAVAGIVEASAEEPVEVPVEEALVAPVEVPEVTEAPVEVPDVAEIPEEVPETIEAPVEAPVEEPIVVEPRIEQTVEVSEMPEGLYIEGNEPGNVALATAGGAVLVAEATVTGSTATEPPSGIRVGLDADGEALPPMSDPVVTRPRSVRFRFANGVLMSVDSKTEGSQEEPARPLE